MDMAVKTIRTVTFHRAHNFGSVLQAYALQRFVEMLAEEYGETVDYKIIDYYSDVQRELYSVFKSGRNLKTVVKNAIAMRHYGDLRARHRKFERFISEKLHLTATTYDNPRQMRNNVPQADYYIAGSDQIWNVRARDASPLYYLGFTPDYAVRISYAASFGPLAIDWAKYDAGAYSRLLKRFDHISVRETGSAANVKVLTGADAAILGDPTFLLGREQWREVQSDAANGEKPYILLYCLEPTSEQIDMVKAVAGHLDLPVVVLRYNNKNDWFNPFEKRYATGPEDFLSYVDGAALVLSSSFHGTAFSLIYGKPFYVLNGRGDLRISSILDNVGLGDRSLECVSDACRTALTPVPQGQIAAFLGENRRKGRDFLAKALQFAK